MRDIQLPRVGDIVIDDEIGERFIIIRVSLPDLDEESDGEEGKLCEPSVECVSLNGGPSFRKHYLAYLSIFLREFSPASNSR